MPWKPWLRGDLTKSNHHRRPSRCSLPPIMTANPAEEYCFRGLAVSRGISTGEIQFKDRHFEEPRRWAIQPEHLESEEARFQEAIFKTRTTIQALKKQLLNRGGDHSEAHIFDAHLLVLEDQTVIDEVLKQLRQEHGNVDSVYYNVILRYIDSLKSIDDPYLRERAIDIEDVAGRLLANLSDDDSASASKETPHVIFAQDLAPSDTVGLDKSRLLGFATRLGSFTSHTAIMARSLGIPGVVGLEVPKGKLRAGQEVILDGFNGVLVVNPTEETRRKYERLSEQQAALNDRLDELRGEPAQTADGKSIILSGNIEFGHEVDAVKRRGAKGIGLYRTEFFYFERDRHPDEDQQAKAYGDVAESVDPDGVIIRTLDVGADKFYADDRQAEPNPFLGWRGIRVSLAETDAFKIQLRACLRASRRGKVRIMYPMISGIEELRQSNALLQECKEELRKEGLPFDEDLEVGCMIELPSAAVMAHQLAPEVDFFSIGTNDLIQYTIAVDRINERVAHLYQPAHPSILRLIEMVVKAAHTHNIWVGVCGEMAGDPLFAPVMIGLGVDELSVGPSQILRVKHALRHLNSAECEDLVTELMKMQTVEEITERCRTLAKQRYGDFYQ